MLPTRRRFRVSERHANRHDARSYIEYRVSYESERRHCADEGGTLAVAARVVAASYLRALQAGRKVRISMQWEVPTEQQVNFVCGLVREHGLRLTTDVANPKEFIVDSLVVHEGEVRPLAS